MIMDFIQHWSWAFSLGIIISIAGWDIKNWRFYVAVIIECSLVTWSQG
jgi:hypothetical protein